MNNRLVDNDHHDFNNNNNNDTRNMTNGIQATQPPVLREDQIQQL